MAAKAGHCYELKTPNISLSMPFTLRTNAHEPRPGSNSSYMLPTSCCLNKNYFSEFTGYWTRETSDLITPKLDSAPHLEQRTTVHRGTVLFYWLGCLSGCAITCDNLANAKLDLNPQRLLQWNQPFAKQLCCLATDPEANAEILL